MAFFNTEVFTVTDRNAFRSAIDTLTPMLEAEGASDVRVFGNLEDEHSVIITSWWTTAEACRAFARNHETDFMTILMPHVTVAEPEYLWEQL